jgi:uncharacterized repeat protein (TIGR01451 family)
MKKSVRTTLLCCGLLCLPAFSTLIRAALSLAAQVQTVSVRGYVLADGGFVQELDAMSPGYSATLDAQGFGTFGWQFTNTTGAALQNVRFVVFLDADIDRDANTFFNEYGEFVSLALPPGAPAGSIAASSWEIDEPGFVFGDIQQNAMTGLLDNTNGVPQSAPDDVSLALGYQAGSLAAGQKADFSFLISADNVGGLRQVDPDSNASFYFNGYALPIAVNTPPTIAGATLARVQGGPGSVSTIATVSDAETPAGSLAVEVVSAPAGISVTNIVNNNGTITATVLAGCGAAVGQNLVSLRVTDAGGLTSLANLIVNVAANSPPTLGSYPASVVVNLGAGTTVTPSAPPADNFSVMNVTASAPGFGGALGVNPATGVVTITNALPVGNFTVTVMVIDNCGATAVRSFAVGVRNEADLAITKSASPDPVTPGGSITYTITVTNRGPNAASDVVITDELPPQVTFTSCAATGGGQCGGSGNSRSVTFAALAPNATQTVTLVADLNPDVAVGQRITNTATVASATADPDTSNNTATASTSVLLSGCTTLAGVVTDPTAVASDQKAGSILVFPYYTSDVGGNFAVSDTLLTITNVSNGAATASGAPNYRFLHLFFMRDCSPADTFVCLTGACRSARASTTRSRPAT